METLRLAVMSVVRNRGNEIDEEDFVKFLSYTKNWISPDSARKLFKTCVEANLLEKKGEKYVPTLELDGIIPLDFKITEEMVDKYTVPQDIFTVMLDKICKEIKINRKEALMKINRIKKEARYVTIEVATLIYCKIEGVRCDEFYSTVEKKLVI